MQTFLPSHWRSAFNPLVGLTMQRVISLLAAAEQGRYADLMWLYRYIEKRDATLMAVKKRRLKAIKKLDWQIKVKEQFTEIKGGKTVPTAAAQRQRDALFDVYDQIDNMKQAVEFLALAEFRGFAHLEKHYRNNRPDEGIHHLEPVPQWYWARNNPNPQWYYNRTAYATNRGVPIEEEHFVILESEDAIDEVAVIAFIRKNMSQKDWDGFVETFGIPPMFIQLPMGSGAVGSPEYQALVEQIMSNSRGVLPNGATLATVPDGSRGGRPFSEHIDYQNQQIVMAATGGLLTALTQATGMNEGQSKNHQSAFDDIAAGAADGISEAFQRSIDDPFLAEKFPNEDKMVYFALASEDIGEGDRAIEDAQRLASAGYEVETAQLSEKTGYRLTNKREMEEKAAKEAEAKAAEAAKAEADAAAKAEAEADKAEAEAANEMSLDAEFAGKK